VSKRSPNTEAVDVLLPVRSPNHSWLRQAIESVVDQSLAVRNLVVVLHPADIAIRPMIESYPISTKIVLTPWDCNLPEALNIGLAECESPLVARLDQDDVCWPERLEQQINLLTHRPDVAVVASRYRLIDFTGETLRYSFPYRDSDSVRRGMRWKCVIAHAAATFRRELILDLDGYRVETSGAEDYDLWLRVLQEWDIDVVDSPLLDYRVHESQMSRSRALSTSTKAAILESRLSLARSRGESLTLARLRHLVWTARQIPRDRRG